jgi:hypothetical protein
VDAEAGEINLIPVDDYSTTTGQWIEFNADDFPEFPADGVKFRALRNRALIFAEVDCTRTVVSATRQTIKCFLTDAQVAQLRLGALDDFRFKVTYTGGDVRTVWYGKLNVADVGEE